MQREPLVGAGRGVALDALPRRIAEAGVDEEAADGGDALDARGEAAIAGDAGVAEVRARAAATA